MQEPICENCGKTWSLGCETCHERDRTKLVELTTKHVKLLGSLGHINKRLDRLCQFVGKVKETRNGFED